MQNCHICGGKRWYPVVNKRTGLQKIDENGRLVYRCFRDPSHIQSEVAPFSPAIERKPDILYFDLEVSKSLYYSYGRKVHGEWLRGADLVHEYFIICWAASYMESGRMFSACVTPEQAQGWSDAEILAPLHDLLSSTAVIAGHNVNAYDLKRVNTRFILNGWEPITAEGGKKKESYDSLLIARSKFAFEDNSEDALCKRFGIRGKDKITDDDWRAVLQGDEKTLKKVHKYCRGDVRNGKELLNVFMPYSGMKAEYGTLKSRKAK